MPAKIRFIRFKNIHDPNQHLAISEIRVFGKGPGKAPDEVKNLKVKHPSDQRNALLTWEKQKEAQGYNVRWGIAPDKLYLSWMVYGASQLDMRCLNAGEKYYFSVEAFNENGVGRASRVVGVPER